MVISAYDLIINVIESKKLTKEDLLDKLDVFLLANRITKDEYKDLIAKIEQAYS